MKILLPLRMEQSPSYSARVSTSAREEYTWYLYVWEFFGPQTPRSSYRLPERNRRQERESAHRQMVRQHGQLRNCIDFEADVEPIAIASGGFSLFFCVVDLR